MSGKIAVFLDRDGTLNQEKGYIRNLDDLALMPNAASAVKKLNDAGLLAILVTNQTGPARGFYGEDHVIALNDKLQRLLKEESGAFLDAVFHCPHLAKGIVPEFAIECDCRKPMPGMINAACEQFPEIDRANSYMVGDKATDVTFGVNAGTKTILLKSGYGHRVLEGKYQSMEHEPTWVCEDIGEAVEQILKDVKVSQSLSQ